MQTNSPRPDVLMGYLVPLPAIFNVWHAKATVSDASKKCILRLINHFKLNIISATTSLFFIEGLDQLDVC